MNPIFTCIVFVVAGLIEANPRFAREDRVTAYCNKHLDHYRNYCNDEVKVDRATFVKLAKFCPAYEKHCSIAKDTVAPLPDLGSLLVVPPPLPRGGQFAALDLPIGQVVGKPLTPRVPAAKTRLTAAIIASCTPGCTAVHCTVECKCANTHPKVNAMCNPPSSAAMANTCQKWYRKCPMFQPLQYY